MVFVPQGTFSLQYCGWPLGQIGSKKKKINFIDPSMGKLFLHKYSHIDKGFIDMHM